MERLWKCRALRVICIQSIVYEHVLYNPAVKITGFKWTFNCDKKINETEMRSTF